MVDAKISIYDLQEAIDIQFPDGRDYDTLGGFILDQVKDLARILYSIKIFLIRSHH